MAEERYNPEEEPDEDAGIGIVPGTDAEPSGIGNEPGTGIEHSESRIPVVEKKPDVIILPSGNDPGMLKRVKGWNWGACILTWIWLYFHEMHLWGTIVLIMTILIPCVGIIPSIWLGAYGNELAWRYKRFTDFEAYLKSVRLWNQIGIIIFISSTIIAIIGISIALYSLNRSMKEIFPNGMF